MVKTILGVLSLLVMSSCSTVVKENTAQPDIMETNKKNLGNLLALYPKPMTVVGAEVEGKVNWLVVGHTGVIDHDRILASMSKSHYTNQGIKQSCSDVALKMEWRVDEDDSTLDILSQPLTVSASQKKHLTVKLPRSMVLHELDIHTVSADVSVDLTEEDTLTLQELDVSSVSGNVSVSAANAGEISLSTTSGAVSGSVRTAKLEADTVSGTVALTLEVLPTELEVETVSGGVALTLTEKPGVPVDVVFRTVSGQLDSDVDSTAGADCVWELETTSGDAVIRIAA